MSKLQNGSRDELEAIRLKALSHFAPFLLQDTLSRLCRAAGSEELDRFEKAMSDAIDHSGADDPDFEDMKEFAVELLHICIREVKSTSDLAARPESLKTRRTPGRSEETQTLEHQLQKGLEDSFPASDPPAVVSTSISGRPKKLVGTDEILARQGRK